MDERGRSIGGAGAECACWTVTGMYWHTRSILTHLLQGVSSESSVKHCRTESFIENTNKVRRPRLYLAAAAINTREIYSGPSL
jgi:hypothetical protein